MEADMINDLTPKQEAFARNIAEGMSYAESYKKAYSADNMNDNAVRVEASRLAASPNISLMVMELQAEAKQRTIYTIAEAMKELEEARLQAIEKGQIASAVSAIEKKAKLHGLFEKDNMQGFKLPPTHIQFVAPDLPLPKGDDD